MKRGDIFSVSLKGAAGKPRPGRIIQADEFIGRINTILVCPLTSETSEAPIFRILIDPGPENGLKRPSQVMVEKVTPARPNEVRGFIGRVSDGALLRVERALVHILGIGTSSLLP